MTLDEGMYLEILTRMDFRHDKKVTAKFMHDWDDVRTAINPKAKWYNINKPKSTTINKDDVIAILTDVSKDIHASSNESYQDILETLIEVEYRIKRYNGGDING